MIISISLVMDIKASCRYQCFYFHTRILKYSCIHDLFNKRRNGLGVLAATGILRTEKMELLPVLFLFSFIFYDYLKFFVHAYSFKILSLLLVLFHFSFV